MMACSEAFFFIPLTKEEEFRRGMG